CVGARIAPGVHRGSTAPRSRRAAGPPAAPGSRFGCRSAESTDPGWRGLRSAARCWGLRTGRVRIVVGLRAVTAPFTLGTMTRRLRASRRLLALAPIAAAALLALSALPASAAEANFPAKDSRYHNYPEMVADIKAVEAAHPSIVHVFSIGKSYQGRDIWAAKISHNLSIVEAEPEVLFAALHHAREHMTVEQALYLLHLLADNYGTDAAITSLVRGREVWIIFAVNPDGFRYDLTCTSSSPPPYCAGRKNRQPNAGTSAIGTDLNRNYGYRWGCCGGSSGNPASIIYRGRAGWAAPQRRGGPGLRPRRRLGGAPD